MYYEGEGGLPKDLARAAELYKKACDGGNATGCYNLGVYYENGAGGLPKDLGQAAELFKKACDQNDQFACERLKDLK